MDNAPKPGVRGAFFRVIPQSINITTNITWPLYSTIKIDAGVKNL